MGEAEIYEIALKLISKTGCLQMPDEDEVWCKKDGSAHSIYCPAGIAITALRDARRIGRCTPKTFRERIVSKIPLVINWR